MSVKVDLHGMEFFGLQRNLAGAEKKDIYMNWQKNKSLSIRIMPGILKKFGGHKRARLGINQKTGLVAIIKDDEAGVKITTNNSGYYYMKLTGVGKVPAELPFNGNVFHVEDGLILVALTQEANK